MSAAEVLLWARQQLDPALREAVATLPDEMRHIAGYHFGWWDEDGQAVAQQSSGKALRPALTLVSAEALGGSMADALPAAVAIELVHNFSLLHDDVMDGDRLRRCRPTAWTIFGVGNAILAGDSLLSLACELLASSQHPRAHDSLDCLTTAVQAMIEGQAADLALQQRDDINLAACEKMAELKTGALLGCSCALGALAAHASPDRVASMNAFGTSMGLAFQYVDDLLGIWGEAERTGKSTQSDLVVGKKSLPVAAALTSKTTAGEQLAAFYRQSRTEVSTADCEQAATLIAEAGGQTWSQSRADALLTEALEHLQQAQPVARIAELHALAELVTHRDR